ncbi:DUF63 family protein [Candidatus Micrarchaeota archaeon]|nr:DUF63 family protein [Candidatus Micrarchaeota archaeon]MBU2476232.1 DUF63 family protein [Candidatus Micrarchaeota archaeon]
MVSDLINEFFINPIVSHSGYNLVNTLVYAGILLIIAFFVVFPFFKKKGINFDFDFLKAVFPFIVFGSTIRIFEENYSAVYFDLFERSTDPLTFGFYTVSPGIYILVGLLTIFSLIISMFIAKRFQKETLKVFMGIGIILSVPVVLYQLLHLTHAFEFFFVLGLTALIVFVLKFLNDKLKQNVLSSKMNLAVLAGQTLDGVATFIALSFFTYSEQHVLSNFVIETFSPAAFILLKVLLSLIVLWYVDKEVEDEKLRNFIKIFVIIIGFAPGIRDVFSLGLNIL